MLTLPDFVVASLKDHLSRQEALQACGKWQEYRLVFTTHIGTPISPRNLVRQFKQKTQEAGLSEIRFHHLRHTAAPLLMGKNTHLLIVSSLLGHSSVNLTLSIYNHVLPSIQKEATTSSTICLVGR